MAPTKATRAKAARARAACSVRPACAAPDTSSARAPPAPAAGVAPAGSSAAEAQPGGGDAAAQVPLAGAAEHGAHNPAQEPLSVGPHSGALPNVHWRAPTWRQLRAQPQFEALPPVAELVQLLDPQSHRRVRQDSRLWSALHAGVLTTGSLNAALGFLEPACATRLHAPQGRASSTACATAWRRLQAARFDPTPAAVAAISAADDEDADAASLLCAACAACAARRAQQGERGQPSLAPPAAQSSAQLPEPVLPDAPRTGGAALAKMVRPAEGKLSESEKQLSESQKRRLRRKRAAAAAAGGAYSVAVPGNPAAPRPAGPDLAAPVSASNPAQLGASGSAGSGSAARGRASVAGSAGTAEQQGSRATENAAARQASCRVCAAAAMAREAVKRGRAASLAAAGASAVRMAWGSAQEAAALYSLAHAFPASTLAEVGLCRIDTAALPPAWGFRPGDLPPLGASPDGLLRHSVHSMPRLLRARSAPSRGAADSAALQPAGSSDRRQPSSEPVREAEHDPEWLAELLSRVAITHTATSSSSTQHGIPGLAASGREAGGPGEGSAVPRSGVELWEVVEVKNTCPFQARHRVNRKGKARTTYVVSDSGPHDRIMPLWVPQLQLEMLAAGTRSALLLSRSATKGFTLLRLLRDDDYLRMVLAILARFHAHAARSAGAPPDFHTYWAWPEYQALVQRTLLVARGGTLVAHVTAPALPPGDLRFFLDAQA